MPTCRRDRGAMIAGLVNPAVRHGRIYNAPLRRETAANASVGADYISKPAIPTAPPANGVGRHAHMPPGPGCDDCRPGEPGGAAWAHIQCAPTAGNGSKRVCRGGLYIKPAIPTAPPANGVGRHAHMPPGPGCDDCRPGEPGGAAWAHIQCAPTAGNGSKRVCRGGLYILPGKPAIPTAPPANGVGRHAHMAVPGCDDCMVNPAGGRAHAMTGLVMRSGAYTMRPYNGETIELRREAEPGSGRPYRPPLQRSTPSFTYSFSLPRRFRIGSAPAPSAGGRSPGRPAWRPSSRNRPSCRAPRKCSQSSSGPARR